MQVFNNIDLDRSGTIDATELAKGVPGPSPLCVGASSASFDSRLLAKSFRLTHAMRKHTCSFEKDGSQTYARYGEEIDDGIRRGQEWNP